MAREVAKVVARLLVRVLEQEVKVLGQDKVEEEDMVDRGKALREGGDQGSQKSRQMWSQSPSQ